MGLLQTNLQQSLNYILAAKAANPAENLPDGAAVRAAVGAAMEEEHLADLLIRICLAKTVGIVTDL